MKKPVKFLHLVISTTHTRAYSKMYEHLSKFYKIFENVETYFLEYDETLDQKIMLQGDKFKLNGKESLVPGLLNKTIEALNYFNEINVEYDYLIRSNSSTVINFNELRNFLPIEGFDYFCAQPLCLGWLDKSSGVIDERWFGTIFAQGTLIGLKRELANLLHQSSHKLRRDLIDDLSIGVFLRENWPNNLLNRIPWERYFYRAHELCTDNEFYDVAEKIKPIAWRNKTSDRDADAMRIEKITKTLIQINGKS